MLTRGEGCAGRRYRVPLQLLNAAASAVCAGNAHRGRRHCWYLRKAVGSRRGYVDAFEVGRAGDRGRTFVACFSHLNIDHALLSRLGTLPTPKTGGGSVTSFL